MEKPKPTIKLADGRELAVRITMRSMMRLEDEFGSTQGVLEALSKIGEGEGPIAKTISTFVVAATAHAQIPEDELISELDVRSFQAYADAIGEAFIDTFGPLIDTFGPLLEPVSDGEDAAVAG